MQKGGDCIDNRGARRLAEGLARCPGLRAVSFVGGDVGEKGLIAIGGALRENVVSILIGTIFRKSDWGLGSGVAKDAKCITELIASPNRKLREVLVWGPALDDRAGSELFLAAKSCQTISTIGVWGGRLGDLSSVAVSEALSASRALDSIYFCITSR